MKPKYRLPFLPATFVLATLACSAGIATAAKTWTGTTDGAWATTTNWLEAAAPGTTETAVFDSNSTANLAITLGANQTIRGISLTSPAAPVTINAGSTLTLGFGGINMSAATQNLTISAPVTAANEGKQSWNIAAGRTLTLAAAPGKATVSACPIEVSTTGAAIFGATTTNLMIDTANNPFVTLGKNDWAGLSAGTVVASTYTDATTALVAGVVNTVKASLTGTNPTDISAIRYNETTAYNVEVSTSATDRTMTARGILVTQNSGGGSLGGSRWNNAFVRPSRTTGNPSFNIIQNSASDFTIGAHLGNASSGVAVRLVKSGTGKLILLQDNSYSSGTFIDAGTLQFGDGSAVVGTTYSASTKNANSGYGFPGGGDIVNNGSLVFNLSAEKTLVHNILGTGDLTQAGSGILNLTTSVSTFTGAVNINAGTLGVTTLANLGSGTVVNMNTGTLKFLAAIDPSVRTIAIGSGGAGFNTNGNAITLANPIGTGSTGAVTKTGAGSLSLAAANTYSGGTTVNAGTLLASNVTGSATGSGNVTVNTGATIGGTGSISGSVSIESGGNLAPGASVGTLAVGNLTMQSGSTLTCEFNTSPNNDKVAVSSLNGLTLNGGALTLLQEGTATPFAAPGTYTLFTYSGTIGGTGVSSLSVANQQPGFGYSFNASGGLVTLTIGTVGVVSDWITNGNGSWPVGSNWSGTVPNIAEATARFNLALSAPATVSLDGSKTVGAVTFLSANAYTIAQGSGGSITLNNAANPASISNGGGSHVISVPLGLTSNTGVFVAVATDRTTLSGIISGSGNLTKTGPGSLSLLASNVFNGLLTLNAGATTFASGGLGAGDLDMNASSLIWAPGNSQDISNRTITFGVDPVAFDTNGNNVSLANPLGNFGTSNFTKAGLGTLTLAADATFSGSTTISAGILQLGNGGTTGSLTSSIINNSNLIISRSDDLTFNNLVSGTGNLEKAGAGVLQITNSNTFNGTTNISNGSILLGNSLALQNSTLNYAAAGGTLSFSTLTAATLGGLSGDKGLVLDNTTPAAVTLTVGGNNLTTAYSGVLGGTGSLVKAGTGLLSLAGVNTYTGFTATNGGTLEIVSGGSVTTTSADVGGAGFLYVNGGTLSASAQTTINSGGALGFVVNNGGSATFGGILRTSTNDGNRIELIDGSLTVNTITLQRTQSFGNAANPSGAASLTSGLIVSGGVLSADTLTIGTSNSGASALFNGGISTISGTVTVGNTSATNRWSILEVRNGEMASTDVTNGVVLGPNAVSANPAQFLITGGTTKVQRVGFGATGAAAGTGLLTINGGTLYVGSGGLVQVPATFTSRVDLSNGTLGALADWSTSLPINLTNAIDIKAADADDVQHHITLNGALTGGGGLTKKGAGTLTLNGGNSYAGTTAVFGGRLSLTTRTLNNLAAVALETGGILSLDFSGGDEVGSLTLDGNSMPTGIYGKLGTAFPGATGTELIEGDGLLYVGVTPPASPYDTWASASGLTVGNSGATLDPDNDGIKNLLEFVLGGNPLTSSTSIVPTLVVDPTNYTYTFTRNDDSEAEVALQFQWGSVLDTWAHTLTVGAASSPADGNGVIITVNEGTPTTNPDTITVTLPRTNAVAGKLFGRVQAVK